jgi:hypothetical protein
MRHVDPTPYTAYMGTPASDDLGMKPGLSWLPISCLRIDPDYQREVIRNGARNIGSIAKAFDWSLFGVVVVANIGGTEFAIVDGQHRTIAAAMRGIEEVPCVIIYADPGQQAKAFAAINGNVTAISKMAIFHAEVMASDADAIALRDACAEADVTVCKYPVPSNMMEPGQTLAIGTLRGALKTYGAAHLTTALRCITRTGFANIGQVKAPIIRALCHVLDAEPAWKSPEDRLLKIMGKFDYAVELSASEVSAKKHKRQVHTELSIRLFDYLDKEIGG